MQPLEKPEVFLDVLLQSGEHVKYMQPNLAVILKICFGGLLLRHLRLEDLRKFY